MISITESASMSVYRAGSLAPLDAVSRVRGALPKPLLTADTPTSAVTWNDHAAGGTFETSGSSNETATYTPANKTQIVTITATDSGGSLDYILTVYGTLPLHPQVNFEVELDIDTKVKYARDKTRYFREDGAQEIGWVFGWDTRSRDAQEEIRQFWRDHRKVIPFDVYDVETEIINQVWFTSSLKWIPGGANRFNLAASVKGIYQPIVVIPPTPPALPTGLHATVLGETSIRWDVDAAADTIAPSVPVMTAPTGVTDAQIVWHWLASTDNVAVTGYTLQIATDSGFTAGVRNIPLGNVLTYADTGLSSTTQYYARVRAHDAALNFSAYSSSTNATTGTHTWSPEDLGTAIFCDYDPDALGLSDGAIVGTAVDQGPHGNDGIATGDQRPTLKTGICNGHDVFRFNHLFIQHFVLPDPSALTESTVFIVVKSTLTGPYGLWRLGGTADETLYGFGGPPPAIYEIFGSTVRRGPFTVTSVTDGFHIFAVRAKASFWQAFFDGTALAAADTTNTFIMDAVAYLGVSAVGSTDSLEGDVARFFMSNRDLTTTEFNNMIDYLRTRYATP